MRKTIRRTRAPRGWLDETSVPYTMFALRSVQTRLRYLANHASTRREIAQLLLTQAHVDEAVGLLAAISLDPSTAIAGRENDMATEASAAHALFAFARSRSDQSVRKSIKNGGTF
jgi:hypothetical protein